MRFTWACACAIAITSATAASAGEQTYAVERAARGFRMQVYETFRTERTQYDQRRTAGDDLLNRWEAAGRPDPWCEPLIEWFTLAAEASRTGGELPLTPELPALAQPQPEPVVSSPQATVPAQPAVTLSTDANALNTDVKTSGGEDVQPSPQALEVSADVTERDAPSEPPLSEPPASGVLHAIGRAIWRAATE